MNAFHSTSASARAMRVRRIVGPYGLGITFPTGDAVVSPSAQLAIAAAYDSLPERPESLIATERTRAAYDAFAAETMAQYRLMRGSDIFHMVTEEDPYTSAADMIRDVERGTILTLATSVTGSHPYLPDHVNDAFRAIHDVFGHAATGRGFDRHGEEAAYQSHAAMYSPLARRALATETRGQNASMVAAGGVFPVQKFALLPEWCTSPDALVPSGPERYEATQQARTMHLAAGLTLSSNESNVRALMISEGIAEWEARLLDAQGIRPVRKV